jgi:stage V sporulation protein B
MSKNRRRFFLNGILLTVVALATRSVGMLFNSYITKAVGAEGIGLYTLIMTVYSFAVTFATSGIGLTVTGLVAKAIGADNPRGVRSVLRCAVLYSLIFSIYAGCTLFFLSEYFALRVLGDQ